MMHGFERSGAAALLVALSALDGTVISLCQQLHGRQEWIRFPRLADETTPPAQALHFIVDNYATHKGPNDLGSLRRQWRFHERYTPVSSSWLNTAARLFPDLTQHRLKRGVIRDVEELIRAIDESVDRHNEHPKPFIWADSARDILEKVKRARKLLNNVRSV